MSATSSECRVEQGQHALIAREQPRHERGGGRVDAEQASRDKDRLAQLPAQRHVHPVVVVRRQIHRGEGAAVEIFRPGARGQQLGEAVVAALGLQQPIAIDRARLADRAVHRAGDCARIRGDGARIGLERAREELIEAAVAQRVGLRRLGHVDACTASRNRESARFLSHGAAHPGRAQHQPRQRMLRQQVLKPHKQAAQDHARAVTMRRKSLCKASTVKGPVRMAARLPSGSMTKMASE